MLKRLRELIPESKQELERDAGEYWASSSEKELLQDLSHWRGQGRWANDEEWQSIGKKHVKMFDELCRFASYSGPTESMAEWGPGGGSNALAFSSRFSRFHGIDISPANLGECERQVNSGGFQPVRKVVIPPENPRSALQQIGEKLDFFLSTAVYQHFPHREYGIEVTRVAFELLKPGALAIIQTRYDDDTKKFKAKKANYSENAVTFTSYRIEEFWRVCESVGFVPLYTHLIPPSNYCYYCLQKPIGGS